ncbi:MAG TPA: type II toxin-antitoxin system VapC family toxin, partial [Gaiellales bacterium]|nr:type II toxin-antitoxin system VapC family toxin [Gaiellales bacterium]
MSTPKSDELTDPPGGPGAVPPGLRVLDASALLTLLFEEPGATVVAAVIAEGAAVSSVNLSEVAAVLVRHQRDVAGILRAVTAQIRVEPFTTADALAAATLWGPTRATGLSLGDRACLALAQRLGVPAVTADREWSTVNIG